MLKLCTGSGGTPRLALLAAFVALLAIAAPAATADESESDLDRFAALDISPVDGVSPERLRAATTRDGNVRVIVELSGASVGERMGSARADGRALTRAQRASIRATLKKSQAPLAEQIQELGGEVVAHYQDAYNGIAANVPLEALAALADAEGVEGIHPVRIFEVDNVSGAQYVDAHRVWQDTGRTGRGIKLGVIDTGIDYTHADFAGPGTAAAYDANNRRFIEQGTFPTAKVAGGWDFTGDDYEANPTDEEEFGNAQITEPKPDNDPLDCNGHGTHVAGTAAGMGVLRNGTTYRGPYNANIYSSLDFLVGPGTAPEATLYAYKIFGCSGSTTEDILVAAFNRALADGMDVINVSVGSAFGRTDEPSAVAADTIALAGVVYVGSAGNTGTAAYVTGAPAAANRTLSVASLDASRATFPGASVALSTGGSLTVRSSNLVPVAANTTLPVKVLRRPDGTVSLGCNPAEYAGTAGMLVVTLRGTCARVARAIFGQKAGAAAVAMIDTAASFPPVEGEITENPDTGEKFTVTIPFLGVRGVIGPSAFDDADTLIAADGGTATLNPVDVPNPGFQQFSTFTSGGVRNLDSAMKPDVTAPGQSVLSAGYATGFRPSTLSGTSMAAPHTAGVAALVNEAHPTWSTEMIKAAIMNTAEAGTSKIIGYDPRRAGSGVVNARRAVDTVVLALAGEGQSALSFGYEGLSGPYSETLPITLMNTGGSPISYSLSPSLVGDALGANIAINPSTVTVPAGSTASVNVTMSLSAAAVAALPSATGSNFGTLRHIVRGAIVATPSTTGTGVYPLRVPFALVPRAFSNVTPGARGALTGTGNEVTMPLAVMNTGIHAGAADVYAWGITDPEDAASGRERVARGNRGVGQPEDSMDIRAAGVQILPSQAICGTSTAGACGRPNNRAVVFAVNMHGFYSTPNTTEVDVAVDTNNDGQAEFFVVGVDIGAAQTGTSDGRFASITFDRRGRIVNAFSAEAPMNGSTQVLPALASDLGLSLDEPTTSFRYWVTSFSNDYAPGEVELVDTTESAGFRVNETPVTTGQFVNLAPGASATLNLGVNLSRAAASDVLGWMIVTHDDPNGAPQADLVPLGLFGR